MEHGFWAGPDRVKAGGGMTLRLLSAREVLEARREARTLAQGEREQALCANACLLARALERENQAVFSDGAAVLEGMTSRQIGALARRWADFDRAENPAPGDGEERCQQLKKAWSTRVMSAFSGACSGCLALCPRRNGRKG